MKKLLILIFAFITLEGISQTLVDFVNPDATWNVARSQTYGTPEDPDFVRTTTKVYGYIGDTVIENKTWLKMYSTPDSNFISSFLYEGSVREENGFVIFMDNGNSNDTIYNFNLETGDSVYYDYGWGFSCYLYLENVDSIEIDGEYFRQFHLSNPNYPPFQMTDVWIEGIGSKHGPLFPNYPEAFSDEIPDSLNLTCYKIDNYIIWSNPYYNDCYVNIVLSAKEKITNTFKIYPNPVHEILRINSSGLDIGNCTISIIDLFGKVIFKENYFQFETVEINTSNLETNFYILQIENRNNTFRHKFTKE